MFGLLPHVAKMGTKLCSVTVTVFAAHGYFVL